MAIRFSEKIRVLLLLAFVAMAFGTSEASRRCLSPTELVEPGLRFTEDGLQSRVAHRLAALSDAYRDGDLPVLLSQVDRRYRLNRRLLGRMLGEEWVGRRDSQLSFRPDRIEGLEHRVEARVRWEKTYVVLATGQRVVERGRCVMVFLRNRFLPLFDVRGDLPMGGG